MKKNIIVLIGVLFLGPGAHAQSPASPRPAQAPQESADSGGSILVGITFSYKNGFPGRIETFDIPIEKALDIGETKNIPIARGLPFGKKSAPTFNMRPNQRRAFALVVKNETDKPWYFFASSHTTEPKEEGLGLTFACLCYNHYFVVEPKSYWYRIVEVRTRGMLKGSFNILHNIIMIPETKAKAKPDLLINGHLEDVK